MWVLDAVVLCLNSCTFVTSSGVHNDVLSEESGVRLEAGDTDLTAGNYV